MKNVIRQRAALRAALEFVTLIPGSAPTQGELAVSIYPDRWRLVRCTELAVVLRRQVGGTAETELRSKVLADLREALEGGGRLEKNVGPLSETVDLPGMFRIAFCSPEPPTGHEAETTVAIVQRTLDSILGLAPE